MSRKRDEEQIEYEREVDFFNYITENKLTCIFNRGYYTKGTKDDSTIRDNISGIISQFYINPPNCKGITSFKCLGKL
jgi:hypothetical protein